MDQILNADLIRAQSDAFAHELLKLPRYEDIVLSKGNQVPLWISQTDTFVLDITGASE